MNYEIAIVGGGAAGVMAALRGCLNNDQCLLFTGNPKDRKKSRELWVSKVENMPDYTQYQKGIVDPNKNCLKWIAESEFAANLHLKKNKSVKKIVKQGEYFELTDDKGEVYRANFVILCTGIMDVQPEIAGSIEPIFPYANAQLADYCLRCDGHHILGKETVVMAKDASGFWVAVMLYERYRPPKMTVLLNGARVELSDELQELSKRYGFVVKSEKIEAVEGNAREKILNGFKLESGEFIAAQMCFISLGMIVYNELAKSLGAELDQRGFVVANQYGESSISGLYVAGDLRANAKKQIYTAWDHAVDAADHINGRIRQNKRMNQTI